MNVPNIGSRAAKPLIITRVSHAIASSSRVAVVGDLTSARKLSQTATTPKTSSAKPPPPSSTSTSTTTTSTTATPSSSATSSTSESSTTAAELNVTKGSSSWLWRTLYLTTALGGAGLAYQYNQEGSPIQKNVKKAYEELDARIRYFTEPSREKLLPDPPAPPYPSAPSPRTLVIDLQDTLVHSSYSRATGWRVAKRPGAEAFLAYMASFYEIVVFTSSLYAYADPILYKLDPNGCIQHRLYRPETHFKNGVYIKDISCLNRPLERVVLIDKDEKCVSMQRDNAIVVPKWTGDPSDTALLDLIPLLEGVVREDVQDVRLVLKELEGKNVQDAVTEYRAQAAARAESAKATGASMFGHVQEAEPPMTPVMTATPAGSKDGAGNDEDMVADGGVAGEEGRSSLWGTMPGRTKLFHSKVNTKQDQKE